MFRLGGRLVVVKRPTGRLLGGAAVTLVAILLLAGWAALPPSAEETVPEPDPSTAVAAAPPQDAPERAAIDIAGDDRLRHAAEQHGWHGSGHPDDPYEIRDLRILVDGQDGVRIQATSLHIVVTKNTIESFGGASVRLIDANNVTVRENTLLGDHAGVVVEDGRRIEITDNRIAGQESGIRLFAGQGHVATENVLTGQRYAIRIEPHNGTSALGHRIERNEIRDVARPDEGPAAGIIVMGRGHHIVDNRLERTADAAVWVLDARDVEMRGNEVDGGGLRGAYIQRADGGTIRDNSFAAHDKAAIVVEDSHMLAVRENRFATSTAAAITMARTHGLQIHDNHMEATRQGIVAWADTDSTLRANRFDQVDRPIDLYDCNATRVTTNRMDDFVEAAISLRGCTDADVHANHVTHGKGQAVFAAASTLLLTENVAERTSGGIVLTGSSEARLVRNILRGSGPLGIDVDGATAFLTDNEVISYEVGLHARDVTGLMIQGGEFSYNQWGIVISGASSKATINGVTFTADRTAILAVGTEDLHVHGNTVDQNRFGIVLDHTRQADVASNHVTENDIGLHLSNTTGSVVWDNLFANIIDPEDRDVRIVGSTDTQWNVTKRDGTNILGGTHIGGNAWHDYQGADVDLDGLGDTPYVPQPCRDLLGHPECVEDLAPFPLDLQPLIQLPVPDRIPGDMPERPPPGHGMPPVQGVARASLSQVR